MLIRAFSLAVCCLVSGPARAEVVVFAAASLKEPLDALAVEFGDVVVSYGGSGTMARQVALGASADLVVLANVDWMNVLVDGGHVRPDSIGDVASNDLVMIGAANMADVVLDIAGIGAALGDGRIAAGLTEAVPAGIYAKQALISLGLWEDMADRLAEVDNVRAALALVARGQAPLGIVYATDARVSDGVRVVATFPGGSHQPIRYVAALTRGAVPEAAAFLAFLHGPAGRAAFAGAGFLPPVDSVE